MKRKVDFYALAILLFVLCINTNLFAQGPTIKYKTADKLMNAGSYDEALVVLSSFYKQNIDSNGNWSVNAKSDEMNNASYNLARLFHNKAVKSSSLAYADSSMYWINVMRKDKNPGLNIKNEYVDFPQYIKDIETLIESKRHTKLISYLITAKMDYGYSLFEYNYYRLKRLNKDLADSVYLTFTDNIKKVYDINAPVDTSNQLYLKPVSLAGDPLGPFYNDKTNYSSCKDISFDSIESKSIVGIRYTYNDTKFFIPERVMLSDSLAKFIPILEIQAYYESFVNSLIDKETLKKQALDAAKREAENKAQKEALEQRIKENEQKMLTDTKYPNASVKVCDYRDGRFSAYVENNTIYELQYNGPDEHGKIFIRNGKKIFPFENGYCQVVIDKDGIATLHSVMESTGERLSDKQQILGKVISNRYYYYRGKNRKTGADSFSETGFLFKGDATTAVICIFLCGNFQ